MRNRGSTNQTVSKTAQGEHKPTGRTDSEAFRIGDNLLFLGKLTK